MTRVTAKEGKSKSGVSRGRMVRASVATKRTAISSSKVDKVQDLIARHFDGSVTKFVREVLAGRQITTKEADVLVAAVDNAS